MFRQCRRGCCSAPQPRAEVLLLCCPGGGAAMPLRPVEPSWPHYVTTGSNGFLITSFQQVVAIVTAAVTEQRF